MDQFKDAANKAAQGIDEGLNQAAAATKSTLAALAATADDAYDKGQHSFSEWKGVACSYWQQFATEQDKAFGTVKGGIEYVLVNPQIGYPLAVGTLFVAVPGFRRGLYRITLGRLRNPEAVVNTAEQKIDSLGTKVTEYSQDYSKLQTRANTAYEEYTRGFQKLKAARQELQRLEQAVGKTEKVAAGLISDLRSVRQMPKATELRAEAAQKLAALKSQRATLRKEIAWIVNKDV